jgi:hypothetical protein
MPFDFTAFRSGCAPRSRRLWPDNYNEIDYTLRYFFLLATFLHSIRKRRVTARG